MKKYILRMEEEPCCYEDGLKYYKCKDVSYWQLSESLLAKLPELEPSLKSAYKRGACDMWDAAKHLWDTGNLSYNWSAEEALTEYLESTKKRPEPYEEWMYADGTKCVVMDKLNDALDVFTENGCIEACTTADLKEYTGRTFPQIAEVLKAMQEGTES